MTFCGVLFIVPFPWILPGGHSVVARDGLSVDWSNLVESGDLVSDVHSFRDFMTIV